MTDIQAALGVEQMKRADEILRERNSIAHFYLRNSKNINWLSMPKSDEINVHGYQSFPLYI